jgi:hypothetical protein
MQLRMTRNTSGPDGSACLVGEVHDLPYPIARAWVAQGRAVLVDDEPLDTGLVSVNGDPVVASAPPPKRRGR